MITSIFCHKPQYHPDEPVCLIAEKKEHSENDTRIDAQITIRHFTQTISSRDISFVFQKQSAISAPVEILNCAINGHGYSVSVTIDGTSFFTAFDVFQSDRTMPRYGFMCHFSMENQDEKAVLYLLKHHITWVQFYDWMYRHEQLLPLTDEFTDLMGRRMNILAVKNRITQCLSWGLKPLAYGAIYAASYSFANTRPDWMLYDGNGNPLDFIGKLRYMNISPGTPWRKHIEKQFAEAISTLQFAGIHLDTYGFPKNALNASGEEIALKDCFSGFIDETREHIFAETSLDPILVFNNVGNWPVDTVSKSKQDAIYIEVWSPYNRYSHLINIIERARILAPDKPIIISAYIKAFTEAPKEEAWESAFVLQSILAASGAHPLLLGEENGILTKAYYPDYHYENDPYWLEIQGAYSDFVVQWQELLYPVNSRNISYTHALGDNREYIFFLSLFSPDCQGGSVGFIIHEMTGYKIIHLIDLRNDNDMWQEGKKQNAPASTISIKVLSLKKPNNVYKASPEKEHGHAEPVTWQMEHTSDGMFLHFEIILSHTWEMIVLET